jgi:hypothetical protein
MSWFKTKSKTKVEDNSCICEKNARGESVSGWCLKHHTDWC